MLQMLKITDKSPYKLNKKVVLFTLLTFVFFSCNKDDENNNVDINSFPLTLAIEGYTNKYFETYTVTGMLENSNISFNDDEYFTSSQKPYLCDEVVFQSEELASFVKLYGEEAASFNAVFENCNVEYLADRTQFSITANSTFPNGYQLTMGGNRSELRLLYKSSKLFKNLGGQPTTSYGAFPGNESFQDIIDDLIVGDTLTIQYYTLVYRP